MLLRDIWLNVLFIYIFVVLVFLLFFGQEAKFLYILVFLSLILTIIFINIEQRISRKLENRLVKVIGERTERLKTFETRLNKLKGELTLLEGKIKKA